MPVVDLHPVIWGYGLLPPQGPQRYWIDHRTLMIPLAFDAQGSPVDSGEGVEFKDEDLWELNIAGEAGLNSCEYSIGYIMNHENLSSSMKDLANEPRIVVREGGFGDKEGGSTFNGLNANNFASEVLENSGISPSKSSSVLFVRGDEVADGAAYISISIDSCYVGRYIVRMEFESWNGEAFLMDWTLGKYRIQNTQEFVGEYQRIADHRITSPDGPSTPNSNNNFNQGASRVHNGHFAIFRDSTLYDDRRAWFTGAFAFDYTTFSTLTSPVLELWWYPQAQEEEVFQIYTCAAACPSPLAYQTAAQIHTQGAHSRSSFVRMFYNLPTGTSTSVLLAWHSPNRNLIVDGLTTAFSRAMVPDYARIWDLNSVTGTRTSSPFLMDVTEQESHTTTGGPCDSRFSRSTSLDSLVYSGAGLNTWACSQGLSTARVIEVRWNTPNAMEGISNPWLQWYEYTFDLATKEHGYQLSLNNRVIFSSHYDSFRGGALNVGGAGGVIGQASFGSFGYDVQVGLGVDMGLEHLAMKVQLSSDAAAFLNLVPVFEGAQVSVCSDDSCLNGGKCYTKWFGMQCICPNTWTGAQCQDPVNECIEEMCYNDGKCPLMSNTGEWTCECAGVDGAESKWTGDFCEKRKNDCPSHMHNFCLNKGLCTTVGMGEYKCTCAGEWTGPHCEMTTSECHWEPEMCKNGGICVDDDAHPEEDSKCDCSATSYVGDFCTIPKVCEVNPCQHGGHCVMESMTVAGVEQVMARCICPSIWFGDFCEDDSLRMFEEHFDCRALDTIGRDPVSPFRECMNGGVCKNNPDIASQINDHWECDCPQGFDGTWCELGNICEHANPCVHGKCVQHGFDTTCICDGTHFGPKCEDAINEYWNDCRTESEHCDNDGECRKHDDTGVYACECSLDFTGPRCQTPHVCRGSPCLNFGKCALSTAGTALCSCQDGWAGKWCETQIDDLVISTWNEYNNDCRFRPNASCGDNGECTQLNSGVFACVCNAGYTGDDCTQHLACDPNPCLNGGQCKVYNNEAICLCAGHWAGERCEISFDIYLNPRNCLIKPCENGGICDLSFNTCLCPDTWRGDFCTEPAACQVNPCHNSGRCELNTFGNVNCFCPGGWYGRFCQHALVLGNSDIKDCRMRPCMNNGECDVFQGEYQCKCQPGWTDTRCQTLVACIPNPCANGGQCHAFGGQPSCACAGAWHGATCTMGLEDSFDGVSGRLADVIKKNVEEAVADDADDDVGRLSSEGETRAAFLMKLEGQIKAFGDSLASIQRSLDESTDELTQFSLIYGRKTDIMNVQELLELALGQ